MNKTVLLLGLLLVAGCAATPDVARQHCLAHDVPHPPNAGQVAGAIITLGISTAISQSRTMADCSEILSDENLKASCPAFVTWCEQYFAELRSAAGAT
jgi:hypothetical protein